MPLFANFKALIALVCLSLLLVSPLAAKTQGELLLLTVPPSYKPSFGDRTKRQMLQEFIPKNQNIKSFREMLSVQIFFGGVGGNAKEFASKMLEINRQVCPGGTGRIEHLAPENGFQTALYSYACKGAKKAGAEWGLGKAIHGRDSFYLVIKVWKRKPSKAQMNDWRRRLAKVRACDTRRKSSPCKP